MLEKIRIKDILFVLLIYLFCFIDLIQNISFLSIFSYFDEFIAIVGFILICFDFSLKKKKWDKKINLIFLSLILFLSSGFISSAINNNMPLFNVALDAFLNIKFFLVVYFGYYIYSDKYNNCFICKSIYLLTLILVVLSLSDLSFGIWSNEYRYGFKCLKLFYTHSTILAATCVFLISCLFLLKPQNYRLHILSIVSLATIAFLTFRAKAMVAILCFVILCFLKKSKTIKVKHLILISFIGLLIGWSYFYMYFLENTQYARSALLSTCFKIANDYFPFGTGFSTYGSAFSVSPYSEVYYQYGLNLIWGLSPDYNSFVSDTFWPMILGQTGVLGMMFYLLALINFTILVVRNNKSHIQFICCFFPLLYLFISSTSESAFVNPIAIPLGIVIGSCLKQKEVNKYGLYYKR